MSPPSPTTPSDEVRDSIEKRWLAVPLQAAHPIADFRSGVEELDRFLRNLALENEVRGIGRTFVLLRDPTDSPDFPEILGFYTLSMGTIPSADLQPHLGGRLPRYPIGVGLVARLANDVRVRRRGIGKLLLHDAVGRISVASSHLGCVGAATDAKDETARDFYVRNGFVELPNTAWPRRLYLPITTIRKLLISEGAHSEVH